ncbi:MAG: 50S ribosomal protein L4 [Candidatus Taylorbacteria bacterium RIFCSPHIGHO2_01_FULL_46_22b]|uniref:Large ribosomal subunit protein uL4 n=1 Tax=Candidatus Taylorbacteria bacterium RIFCSPHIGHO2_01_FULL_46_22b TaxID=1802301 RepID=A0A1G2M2N8_9BACT|nr:MAG: 50S ribosomal protein L4 [Candidatus Taylorbacteria bacterium RIFCSPHIGHO2_01_FULL_46_22b]
MEATVYNTKGKETGKVTLPEKVFGAKWNGDLVHQVMVSMQANEREHVAHVKDRGQVAGGGKKPWQQKGTGRARHGSIRSPIWVGGGVAHGPNPNKVYARKVNQKMRVGALYAILSKKYKDGEMLFVDTMAVESGKTKDAKVVINALAGVKGYEKLATKPVNAALIAVAKKDNKTGRSLRNFSNVLVEEVRNLNPMTALSYKYIVISDPEIACKGLAARMPDKKRS